MGIPPGPKYNPAVHDGQQRRDILYFVLRNGEVIRTKQSKVRQITWGNPSLFIFLIGEPRSTQRVQLESFFSTQAIVFGQYFRTRYGLTGHCPANTNPWVVARGSIPIRSQRQRNTAGHQSAEWRCLQGLFPAV